MNVYEAYLEVKQGNIVRADIGRDTYFILRTIEMPILNERIIKIDLDSAEIGNKCPEHIGNLDYDELENICITSFEEKSSFKVVSMDELMKECQDYWNEKKG